MVMCRERSRWSCAGKDLDGHVQEKIWMVMCRERSRWSCARKDLDGHVQEKS